MMDKQVINWLGPKIQVVGVGAVTHLKLASAATEVIGQADVIIGAAHQLEQIHPIMIAEGVEVRDFPRPLSQLLPILEERMGRRIVILASGDPLYFGIGAWLNRHIGSENCHYFPNVSSVQSAFALIGKNWQNAKVVSLHGRPLLSLRSQIVTNSLYAILTDHENTPLEIAREMVNLGFAGSDLWVAESLGLPQQKLQHFTCKSLASKRVGPRAMQDNEDSFSALNVCIVETKGQGYWLSTFPGIPDQQFTDQNDTEKQPDSGMFTKREVRLAILSLIQPGPGMLGWDVGAGYGSVAVEWARWSQDADIYAVEADIDRLATLKYHREKFGVMKNLHIRQGLAPDILVDLPNPDAIYIGGSHGGIANLLDYCWSRLKQGGRVVVSAVTESTRAQLINHVQHTYNDAKVVEWTEIAVSRGDNLAGQLLLRPRLPVLILYLVK